MYIKMHNNGLRQRENTCVNRHLIYELFSIKFHYDLRSFLSLLIYYYKHRTFGIQEPETDIKNEKSLEKKTKNTTIVQTLRIKTILLSFQTF